MEFLLNSRIVLLTAITVASEAQFSAAALRSSKCLSSADTSSSVAVWVYFTDKRCSVSPFPGVSPGALARRRSAKFHSNDDADLPVCREYLRGVERMGGRFRNCFKWENAASFDLSPSGIEAVKALPYVKQVTLVGRYGRTVEKRDISLQKRRFSSTNGIYGRAFDQLSMINVPRAHEYLSYRGRGAPGKGIRIALFDSGFRLRHRCFRHLVDRNGVIAAYDFVDGDTSVEDPDSVFNDPEHPYYFNDEHGSLVLSIIASYDPPYYCGAAWGADFLLARTEDAYMYNARRSREVHTEEDNWAAAVVWAESLGVDIISSSVAYREGFEDSVVIDRGDGRYDTIFSYSKSDMDGKTTIVSRAAKGAVERGVIVVCSIGNEGYEGDTSLDAPADVDGVISVGMVDLFGLLDGWSSRGPTADGRDKPDVVAPGSGVFVPEVYSYESTDSYLFEIGSSFATPHISGICALIKQSDISLDAASVRERLYRFCRSAEGTSLIDWGYGRGIPDALLSCMKAQEVYLSATDSGGKPIDGAIVKNSRGDTIASFDNYGKSLFVLNSSEPAEITVCRLIDRRSVYVESVPFWKELYPCTIVVNVKNEHFSPLARASVSGVIGTRNFMLETDSTGRITIENFFTLPVRFAASKEGYLSSDTIRTDLKEQKQERTIQLFPAVETRLILFPNVIRRGRGEKLHIRCICSPASLPKRLEADIRTITGHSVWRESRRIDVSFNDIAWDCRTSDGNYASPGTYFIMTVFDGKKRREKIIIAP